MITITDTDNKPLSGLRLRPAQVVTIRLSTNDLTPLIASIQATRADFLLTEPVGEAESVSRGNGQELLDSGLVEVLLEGEWVSLTTPQEIGLIMQNEPVDAILRVKNVGQAVGEVAFGLAAIGLNLNKLMIPTAQVLTVSGFDGHFLRLADDDGWLHYPSNYAPMLIQDEMRGYVDVDFLEVFEGETTIGSFVASDRTVVANGIMTTPEGYLPTKLDNGASVKRGSISQTIPLTADLTMVMVGSSMLLTVPLYAATGEDYTHKSAAVNIDDLEFYISLKYTDGVWNVIESYYDEDEEEWIEEPTFHFETLDDSVIPAVFGDNGVYFFRKED